VYHSTLGVRAIKKKKKMDLNGQERLVEGGPGRAPRLPVQEGLPRGLDGFVDAHFRRHGCHLFSHLRVICTGIQLLVELESYLYTCLQVLVHNWS